MWEAIKSAVIENAAKVLIAGFVALAGIVAASLWAVVKEWGTVPTYYIQNAERIATIDLTPSDGETRIIGVSTGVNLAEGYCALSLVGGDFGRQFERVGVYLNDGGEWVYDYRHGASKINGRIDCYSHPKLIRSN